MAYSKHAVFPDRQHQNQMAILALSAGRFSDSGNFFSNSAHQIMSDPADTKAGAALNPDALIADQKVRSSQKEGL